LRAWIEGFEQRNKLVSTGRVKFETLTQRGNSINQIEKTMLNKDLNFTYSKLRKTTQKPSKTWFFIISSHLLMVS